MSWRRMMMVVLQRRLRNIFFSRNKIDLRGEKKSAEFVVVRRHGEGGGLVLDGAMSDAYYKVRDVNVGHYHIS